MTERKRPKSLSAKCTGRTQLSWSTQTELRESPKSLSAKCTGRTNTGAYSMGRCFWCPKSLSAKCTGRTDRHDESDPAEFQVLKAFRQSALVGLYFKIPFPDLKEVLKAFRQSALVGLRRADGQPCGTAKS